MSPFDDSPELNEFESVLRSLAPAKTRVDRDRLLFLAGQATVPARAMLSGRERCCWLVVNSSLAVAVVVMGLALARTPTSPAGTPVATTAPVTAADPSQESPRQPRAKHGDPSLVTAMTAPAVLRRRGANVGLLPLRDSLLFSAKSDSVMRWNVSPPVVAKTARETMRELMWQQRLVTMDVRTEEG